MSLEKRRRRATLPVTRYGTEKKKKKNYKLECREFGKTTFSAN